MDKRNELRCKTDGMVGVAIDWEALTSVPVHIEDCSGSGCKLRLLDKASLPKQFDLALEGYRDLFACAVRWAHDDVLGVEFISEETSDGERRGETRRLVRMAAKISNRNKSFLRIAKIHNATRAGCMVEASGIGMLSTDILVTPDKFVEPIPATIVWKRGNLAGLAFAWNLGGSEEVPSGPDGNADEPVERVAL